MTAEALDKQEQPCADASCARESLSCLASSLQNLQNLMEEEDFEGISDVFLRICKGSSSRVLPIQHRLKVSNCRGGSQASQSSTASTRMYFGATRPSSASTAVPSSSLSLCSASLEPSSAPDLPQEQASLCVNGDIEYEGKAARKNSSCQSTNGADVKHIEPRKENEGDTSRNGAVANTESSTSNILEDDTSCCAETPSKKNEALLGSKGEARGKASTVRSPTTFLARRSPRLQNPSQGTCRQEALSSPASNRRQLAPRQPQPWGSPSLGPSGATERNRKQLSGGKRRQGLIAGPIGPKRRREEGALEPLSCRKMEGKSKRQVQADFAEGEARTTTPPKSAVTKRKGNYRGNPPQASSLKKRTCGYKSVKPWQWKKAKMGKEEAPTESEAPDTPSPARSHDASEAGDESICRFALPVLKEDIDTPSRLGLADSDPRFIALSRTPVEAVQQKEACTGGDLRPDETGTPGGEHGRLVALQHKVLRALPEPTPQFDFGLFIVRAAAMSKHADDIFPLLEDEELMERSVVFERYLGPPKEGSKRRGDHFMLDKLVAEIPNHGGVYRPFLDIKEAPWCTGLDSGDGKVLPKKEVLRQRIEIQRRWNPFSIFGSSPPSVELEDVFGYEVYQRTAPSARVHHPLFRRLSQFQSFKDLYSSLSKEEWDRVSSAFRHHWNKQCRLDLDWTNDPLTVDEIMWMLEANEQVEDRSSHVYEAEICYCVTPNPNVGFGWNDPRCHRYKAPRPSMGCHILTQPPLVDGFFEDKGDAEAAQVASTREPSSFSDPADTVTAKGLCEEVRARPDDKEQVREELYSVQAASRRCDAPITNGKQQALTESLPTQVPACLG